MNFAPATSILIVEDEETLAEHLQQCLIELGYEASAIAASSAEALAFIAHKCPDVILMDIHLAGSLDGIQTASLLKHQCAAAVIYVTGHADTAMIELAKHTAPQGYLIKPFEPAELRSTIEIAVYNRQLDAEKMKRLAAEHRLNIISDNIPIAVAYFDVKGKVQFANRVFRELVPYRDNPIGVAAITFLGDELYQRSYPARQRALLGETAGFLVDIEHRGVMRHHEVTYVPDHDHEDGISGVYTISADITERNQLSADLRLAHLDLETLLNAVPASITSWHRDLTFRFANEAARRQFKIPDGGKIGVPMREVIGSARFEEMAPHLEKVLAGHDSIFESTEPSGDSIRYICNYLVPERKGPAVVGMYALAFDITDLHESHESIHRLALRLETVREDEQRSVATILHDGIAQDLFAVKLGVDALPTAPPEELSQQCQALSGALARCMGDMRQLAHSLRPVALSRSDVAAAIADHARYFSEQSRLVINVDCSTLLPLLPDAAQLLLFRAAQEALTNVARHADARVVSITLWSDNDKVWLKITDDGVGIRADALLKKGSLGLLALQERFSAAGGSITIDRAHPTGTRVIGNLPTGKIAS